MSNNDKGLNILVAEDDPVSSKVLESFLAPFGTTTLAEDGEQAISALRAELEKGSVFDIIFLDIMMPEVDGVECVKLIREEEEKREIFGLAGVKIVMATALSNADSVLGSFRNGCEEYLVKPIQKKDVIKVLRKLDLIPEK